jgi:hypothetical protein
LISPSGYPARIVEFLRTGEVRVVLDDRISHEYAEVLKRPAFGFPENEIEILLEMYIDLNPLPSHGLLNCRINGLL